MGIHLDHKRINTNEKPHSCDICEASFTHLSSLRTHKIHTSLGEKPYTSYSTHFKPEGTQENSLWWETLYCSCDMCTSAFTKASDLRAHKSIITGQRPYKYLWFIFHLRTLDWYLCSNICTPYKPENPLVREYNYIQVWDFLAVMCVQHHLQRHHTW